MPLGPASVNVTFAADGSLAALTSDRRFDRRRNRSIAPNCRFAGAARGTRAPVGDQAPGRWTGFPAGGARPGRWTVGPVPGPPRSPAGPEARRFGLRGRSGGVHGVAHWTATPGRRIRDPRARLVVQPRPMGLASPEVSRQPNGDGLRERHGGAERRRYPATCRRGACSTASAWPGRAPSVPGHRERLRGRLGRSPSFAGQPQPAGPGSHARGR